MRHLQSEMRDFLISERSSSRKNELENTESSRNNIKSFHIHFAHCGT